MNSPGDKYGFEFFRKIIEYHAACGKTDEHERGEGKGKPTYHHRNVIKRKGEGAECVGDFPRAFLFQISEGESSEEEFLEKGICEGDVKRHKNKI